MISQRPPKCLPSKLFSRSPSRGSDIGSQGIEVRSWRDPRVTAQCLGPRSGGAGPAEGAWEVRAVRAPPGAVPSPRRQGVRHRMTKPREKSSAGCGPVMKLSLCLAPSSLVTQGRVCEGHGHPTWVWRHLSIGLQHSAPTSMGCAGSKSRQN